MYSSLNIAKCDGQKKTTNTLSTPTSSSKRPFSNSSTFDTPVSIALPASKKMKTEEILLKQRPLAEMMRPKVLDDIEGLSPTSKLFIDLPGSYLNADAADATYTQLSGRSGRSGRCLICKRGD